MALRSIPSRFIAMSEEAPQSIRNRVRSAVTWKQVLKRPPEPKASPEPTNVSRMPPPVSGADERSNPTRVRAAARRVGHPFFRPAGKRTLPWVIAGPAIAMRELMTADLALDVRRHRPPYTRNHQEAPVLVDLRAAEGAIRRHDPVHRVAKVLDLRQGALPHGQCALVSMIIDGRRGSDRTDRGLRGIHDHAVRGFEVMFDDVRVGASAPRRQACMSISSKRRGRNLRCRRQTDRCTSSLVVPLPLVIEFFVRNARATLVSRFRSSQSNSRRGCAKLRVRGTMP